jgi:putative transposase
MHRLAMAYSKAINKRYERSGPLFQGPFKSILVDQDAYLLHLSRYIHLNPVEAGFVDDLRDWEFSSYHEYAGLRSGTLPNTEPIQEQLSSISYQSFLDTPATLAPALQPLLLDA